MRRTPKEALASFGETMLYVGIGMLLWPLDIVWHAILLISFPIRFALDEKE